MKKFRFLLFVFTLITLTGCGPTEDEIILEAVGYLENSQYRFLDDILYDIKDSNTSVYDAIVEDSILQIDDSIQDFLDADDFDSAIELIEEVKDELRFIDLVKYNNLLTQITDDKVEFELYGVNYTNFDSAIEYMEDDVYQAVLLLKDLDSTLDYGVDITELLTESRNMLGADVYKYYFSASSISDLYYFEDQLVEFVDSISEEEQYTYLYDLLDLIWHSDNFDLADLYLEEIVEEHYPQYLEDLLESNESIKSSAVYYDSAGLAEYLEDKSAIVKVYDQNGYLSSTGSAFFINDIGYLVTNEHVVNGGYTVSIATSSGDEYPVTILMVDEVRDFALLRANITGNTYVELGNSYLVSTGDQIFTYGSPLGVSNTLTDGVISNQVSIVNGQEFIQISAPISPGSSGGMLVDKTGKVIGITSAYLVDGQNMNLAIPINRVIDFIQDYDSSVTLSSKYPQFYKDITESTIDKLYSYQYIQDPNQTFTGFIDEFGEKVYGIFEHANGDYYEGELKDRLYHGIGWVYWNDEVYIGEFAEGDYSGTGQLFYEHGDFYIGDFTDGYRNGDGSYFWGSEDNYGHVYIGDYVMDDRTGYGMYLYPDGSIYLGDYVDSEMTGQGTYYSSSGWQYTGEYVNGYETGYGILYYINGSVHEGYFEGGFRNGVGTTYYSNGDYYTGPWINDDYNGYGTYYYISGVVHEGYFADSIPTGLGTRNYINGDYFTATWTDWCDGSGTYYWTDGSTAPSTLVDCAWID